MINIHEYFGVDLEATSDNIKALINRKEISCFLQDKDKFLKYYDDLIKNCDKMSVKRMKDFTEEIMKTY